MKRLLIIIVFIGLFQASSSAQEIDTIRLKVINFKELADCYILSTFNKKKSDSVFLISAKDTIPLKRDYKKICIGKEYNFVCKSLVANLAAMPLDNFALKIKNTVVWRGGDNVKKRPLLALNVQNLYIKEVNK
jgi:hypothetical protein